MNAKQRRKARTKVKRENSIFLIQREDPNSLPKNKSKVSNKELKALLEGKGREQGFVYAENIERLK